MSCGVGPLLWSAPPVFFFFLLFFFDLSNPRYCYKSLKNLLSPISPLGKFMCIKMVVFATFWQQTFFTILFWTKWGKSINWCDPIACCLLEDADGSSAYSERCDNHNQHVDVSCGFCPDKATYDSAGNKETGSDYHVLENNTMQATLVRLPCAQSIC